MDILKRKVRAPPEQQAEIAYLLAAGAIGPGDAKDILQRFRKKDPHVPYWERCYPGKGATLMRVLGRCYSWDGTLQPYCDGVQDALVRALFWVNDLPSPLLIHPEDRHAHKHDRHPIKTPLQVHLQEYLTDVTLLEHSPWEPLETTSGDHCVAKTYFRQYRGQFPRGVRDKMWLGYDAVVRYICAYIVANDDGRHDDRIDDLDGLITLIHTGRIPVGFTAIDPVSQKARPVLVSLPKPQTNGKQDLVSEIALRACVD